jgi:ABC-type transporter Mla subunit MlaD
VPPAAAPTPEPLSQALRSLRQVTDALSYVQQSFADALLKLPRAEDFEPLVAPLSEFARVAPALADTFREMIRQARPTAAAPREGGVQGQHAQGSSQMRDTAAARFDEARRHVDAAREAVRQALGELPRDADYRRVAAQLRELASVSPSLMDWLKEVPKLTTPLSGSVAALRRAAADLETASDLLAEDVPAAAPTPRPR